MLERVADCRGLFRAAALENVDERQRGFSLAQIVAEVFSGFVQLPGIVEHIVDKLERGAKMGPIGRKPFLDAALDPAKDSAEASGCLEELRGLAPNHFEILRLVHVRSEERRVGT